MEVPKRIYVFLVLIASALILIYAQSVIIPFILAILFWYMIRVFKKILLKIKFVDRLPGWILTTVSSLLLFSFLLLIVNIITNNIQQISETMPVYQANINKITVELNSYFNIDVASLLDNFAKNLEFPALIRSLISALTGLFGNAVTIVLYLIFLLLEENMFPKKIKVIYPDPEKHKKIDEILNKIDKSIINYVALKTVISILTGILSYLALLFIGIDAPFFWAFLIFILNFIPNIGSLAATVFPAIFALLQFGRFTEGFLVLGIVGMIQLVIGNFIEPKVMGNSLNISPLVVILTLTLWGVMWGITGMLLSVPITVILIIIMAEFPSTRPFAILLSQDGQLNTGAENKF